jgi:hypothetical protein
MKSLEPTESELAKMDPGVATFWMSGAPGPHPVFVLLRGAPTAEAAAFFASAGLSLQGPVGAGPANRATLLELLRRADVLEVADGAVAVTP